MDRTSGFCYTHYKYILYIWKLGTSMKILIYHKTVYLHACKYSKKNIFHVKNYRTLKVVLNLNYRDKKNILPYDMPKHTAHALK